MFQKDAWARKPVITSLPFLPLFIVNFRVISWLVWKESKENMVLFSRHSFITLLWKLPSLSPAWYAPWINVVSQWCCMSPMNLFSLCQVSERSHMVCEISYHYKEISVMSILNKHNLNVKHDRVLAFVTKLPSVKFTIVWRWKLSYWQIHFWIRILVDVAQFLINSMLQLFISSLLHIRQLVLEWNSFDPHGFI